MGIFNKLGGILKAVGGGGGDLLAVIAPTLATAAGGPLAGMAVTKLMGGLGINVDDVDADKHLDAVLQNPTAEQLTTIKQIDADFKKEMGKQQIDLERIVAADRDSARNREIQTGDNTNKVLAFAVTAGFFGVLGMLAFAELPEGTRQIVNIMVGFLGAGFGSVMQYYFGSSKGSKDKTAALTAIGK